MAQWKSFQRNAPSRIPAFYCMTLNRAACNPKDAEEAAKKMVDEWHKAILENRIKEVMGDGDASEVKNCSTNS